MDSVITFYDTQPVWAQSALGLALLMLMALTINYILKHIILRLAAPYMDAKSLTIDKAAAWLATVIPLVVVSRGIRLVEHLPEDVYTVVTNVAQAFIVISVAMAMIRALSYGNELYERLPRSKNRPIKGFIQVVKIAVACGAAIIMISVLIDESPLLLLSGLGAMAAVLLLVFKDTILSLVASVQLTSQDMLRRGDWITMPGMNADGDVIDISLHTVKVQNFDKTIVTIPTHRLVSDSFQNWRGMNKAGGRRIKRALHLDQNAVRFLTAAESDELRRFRLLKPYLADKDTELVEWNQRELDGDANPVNARRLTNIGTFRAYVIAYLRAHPELATEKFTLLVRQLSPTPQGLPLEVYCFTKTTKWVEYERIQADLFDHLIAILPEFGLRLYQQPSGLDLSQLSGGG